MILWNYLFFRILELEQDFKINNRNVKGEIELWDCSGDTKYANIIIDLKY